MFIFLFKIIIVMVLPPCDYAGPDRVAFAVKCHALLVVVDERRRRDGFVFPGEPSFDSTLFPTHLLTDAFRFIAGKMIIVLFHLLSITQLFRFGT